MAFGGFDRGTEPRPMAEINTTPLVDVMLVLLIIFIVTAPLLTHAIRIDLPHASSRASEEEPQAVTVSVNALGEVFWDAERVTSAQLLERMTRAARAAPQPALRLRVDREVRYQQVAELLAAARDAGLTRLSFVTDPRAPSQPVQPSASGSLQPGQALPDPSPGS
jgi:biopolymer transport protein ExbD